MANINTAHFGRLSAKASRQAFWDLMVAAYGVPVARQVLQDMGMLPKP